MTPLDTFLAKLAEYGTNNISALEGRIQFTSHERDDLKLLLAQMAPAEKAKAIETAKAKGLDTSTWG